MVVKIKQPWYEPYKDPSDTLRSRRTPALAEQPVGGHCKLMAQHMAPPTLASTYLQLREAVHPQLPARRLHCLCASQLGLHARLQRRQRARGQAGCQVGCVHADRVQQEAPVACPAQHSCHAKCAASRRRYRLLRGMAHTRLLGIAALLVR